jgi:Flp pilus assembly protein CpaB
VLGTVATLTWLAYAPIRHRGREGVWILPSALLVGIAILVPIHLVMAGYNHGHCFLPPDEGPEIAIATRDLAIGETIDDGVVVETLPPGAVRPVGAFGSWEAVIGRVPTERILAGEPIREERLAALEMGVGQRAVTPRGLRTVRIHPEATPFRIEPGQHVDVVSTARRHVVREALVLQRHEDDDLTLAVPPADVEPLADAGSVKLILVGDAPAP